LTSWMVARDGGMTSDNLINLASWAKGFNLTPQENLFKNAEKFIAYATRYDCFRRFLLENGYIEKVKPDNLEGFFG